MMRKATKKYTLTVYIEEGNDEFWEELNKENKTGCDTIVNEVKRGLAQIGYTEPNCHVRLTRFEET